MTQRGLESSCQREKRGDGFLFSPKKGEGGKQLQKKEWAKFVPPLQFLGKRELRFYKEGMLGPAKGNKGKRKMNRLGDQDLNPGANGLDPPSTRPEERGKADGRPANRYPRLLKRYFDIRGAHHREGDGPRPLAGARPEHQSVSEKSPSKKGGSRQRVG